MEKELLKIKRVTLPMDLFQVIKKMAKENDRSVNKEITTLLKKAVKI